MDKTRTLGENIKRLRKSRGIRQEDLAEALGVSPATLSIYENGGRSPKFTTLQKMAELLKVSVAELDGGHDQGTGPAPEDFELFRAEELAALGRILEMARATARSGPHGYARLGDDIAKCEEMIRNIGKLSENIRDTRAKLDYTARILKSLKPGER